MLQVTQKVDVICSAISIKEAMIMCPITTWVCDGIKGIIRHQGHIVPIELTPEQCIAIGQVLGKLGFVNEMGENPLELIQDRNVEEPEQGPKCLECPE